MADATNAVATLPIGFVRTTERTLSAIAVRL
jgi:hypothetical protein